MNDVAATEVRLAPESIEAVAQRVAELIAPPVPEGGSAGGGRISAEEVSRRWGVRRRWVYDHADELGARRLGRGSRPRLRFDPDEVAEHLGPPEADVSAEPDMRGLPPNTGDPKSGSLCTPSRATVGRRHKRRPGRAV